MAKVRPFKRAYIGLWLVRIWFALYGMGYIHPDEHMQNGEVTAGILVFGSGGTFIDGQGREYPRLSCVDHLGMAPRFSSQVRSASLRNHGFAFVATFRT